LFASSLEFFSKDVLPIASRQLIRSVCHFETVSGESGLIPFTLKIWKFSPVISNPNHGQFFVSRVSATLPLPSTPLVVILPFPTFSRFNPPIASHPKTRLASLDSHFSPKSEI